MPTIVLLTLCQSQHYSPATTGATGYHQIPAKTGMQNIRLILNLEKSIAQNVALRSITQRNKHSYGSTQYFMGYVLSKRLKIN
jgi:hypothetical protein